MDYSHFFFHPTNSGFLIALGILFAFLVVELINLFVGFSFAGDSDLDGELDTDTNMIWNWLNAGNLPIMALMIVFLSSFVIIGYTIQFILFSSIGILLPWLANVPLAFALSLPVIRQASIILAKIMPKDETSAIKIEELVDAVAEVVLPATNIPGQAKVEDRFGTTHYIFYFTDDETCVGDKVALLSLEKDTPPTFEARKIHN